MQSVTFRTRYSPRAKRSGVLSNRRSVRGRALGPMNGCHPMVNVIPAAKTSASTTNTKPSVLPNLFMLETCYGVPESGMAPRGIESLLPNNRPSQYSRDPVDRLLARGSDISAKMIPKRTRKCEPSKAREMAKFGECSLSFSSFLSAAYCRRYLRP